MSKLKSREELPATESNTMYTRYVSKGLLFDEQEAEMLTGEPIEEFDQFFEAMTDVIRDDVGWTDYPLTTLLGIASERFDTANMADGINDAEFVKNGTSWNETITQVCCQFGHIEQDVMTKFLIDEDVGFLTGHLKEVLFQQFAEDDYEWAREKLIALENLKGAGLPCFQPSNFYSRGGVTGLFDMRGELSHPITPGRRVLVEIEHAW